MRKSQFMLVSLLLATSMAASDESQIVHLRPAFSAAAAVVPVPAKKSPTRSPLSVAHSIILRNSDSGF